MRMDALSKKMSIFGIEFDSISYAEVLKKIVSTIKESRKISVVTPYSEIIMAAIRDESYKNVINSASIILPDGMGVIVAARFMGMPLKDRITGVDLSSGLIDLSSRAGYRLFFLGSRSSVLMRLSKRLLAKYPNLKLEYYAPPFRENFSDADNDNMIERINRFRPNILFVAFGPPKQEKWIISNLRRLEVNVALGVGGTLDLLAGSRKRAPTIMQKCCLEWLYRLMQDPSRIRRQLVVPIFIVKTLSIVFARKRSKECTP